MAQVSHTVQAERDLLEIWVYYAEQRSVEAAERLLRSLGETCRRLAEMPGIGRSREDLAPGLRSLPSNDYILYYRRIEDGIRLIRVLHGARQVADLFPEYPTSSDTAS